MSVINLRKGSAGVRSVPTSGSLPATGNAGDVYVATDSGVIYAWSTTNSSWEPPLYNPATDSSAIAVWESDKNVTLSGSNVTGWNDQVSGIVGTGASSHQPTIASAQLNGLQTVKFNAIGNTGIGLPTSQALIPAATSPWSLAFIAKNTGFTNSTFQGVFNSWLSGSSEIFDIELTNDSTYGPGIIFGSHSAYASGGTLAYQAHVTFDTTNYHYWQITYNGSGGTSSANFGFKDGNSSISITTHATATIGAGSTNSGIGTANSSTYGDPADFYLAAIYLFNTASLPSNLKSYVNSKWGFSF